MSDTEISDALLAVRCQLGDKNAWEVLVKRWHPRLQAFVGRMLSDPQTAEDTLQTVWLKVIRSLGRLREPERLSAWLYRVARLTVADQLRARYAEPDSEPFEDVAEHDDADALVVLGAMEAGLDRLHPLDREALVLHYVSGLSVAGIAVVCSVPEGTVKSRLHRARRNLRNALSN